MHNAASPTVRRFRLTVVEGPARGVAWQSTADRCSIGSHHRNDLIVEDPTVSRFHCEIAIDEGGVRVRDLKSRNGTVLDGVAVLEAFLRAGSLLRLGKTVVRFELGTETNRLPLSEETRFGSLTGVSPAMRAVFAMLARAAESDATVLLEGETGTGKSQAAMSVHQKSTRHAGPFVIVDCGAIPGNLLESELFGHEKGSFTGATVDVRVIAATNRDLRADVNAGRFRADLYFRLAIVTIGMPPLRRRPRTFRHWPRRSRVAARTEGGGRDAALARAPGADPRRRMAGQRARAAQLHRTVPDPGHHRAGLGGYRTDR